MHFTLIIDTQEPETMFVSRCAGHGTSTIYIHIASCELTCNFN